MFATLLDLSAKLGPRMRRLVLLVATAGMGLYASTTATALNSGDTVDLLTGILLLGGFTILAALTWAGRPVPARRRH